MKQCLLIVIVIFTTHANAHILHIGNTSVPLSENKNTSPALAVDMDNKIYWGALYTDTAPANTLRIQIDDINYWLGEYCTPGTYAAAGTNACIACGIGHYCTGGHARETCTYGAISCPGTTHSTDAELPSGADAAINNFMTADQVTQYIPPTDISQWERIMCGSAFVDTNVTSWNPGTINLPYAYSAQGIIGPGTYLFVSRYNNTNVIGTQDSLEPNKIGMTTIKMAVFNKPVGVRSLHANDIFQFFVDTEHAPYQAYTISSTPIGAWGQNTNTSNVSNIPSVLPLSRENLCVFELK